MRSAKEAGRRSFATYRNGHDGFPGWGGMSLRSDPGSVPPNLFRYIENARPLGGNWRRRPGQELLNTETVHAEDAWFRVLTDVFTDPFRLYLAAGGCISSTTEGFAVLWFDIDQNPRIQRGTWYETIDDIQIGIFDGLLRLALSVDSPRSAEFRTYQVIPQSWGTDQADLAGLKQEYPHYTFVGHTVRWMEAFDDKFFFSLDDGTTGGAADNRLATYNGLSMNDGSTAAMPADRDNLDFPVTVMCRHRDFLVAGYLEDANSISVRESGEIPAVWHEIAPATDEVQSRRMIDYKNILYIFPGNSIPTPANAQNVWAYNDADPATFLPASLTIVRTVAANGIVNCGAVHNGFLFYGWYDSVTGDVFVGRYDGTTWDDTHKQINAQGAASGSDPTAITRIDELKSYRGSLYAVVFCPQQLAPAEVIDEGSYLIYTEGNDTDGDWHIDNARFVAGGTVLNLRRLPVTLSTGGVVKNAVVM